MSLAIVGLAVVLPALAAPADPPTKAELTEITRREKLMAEYDVAAWHATDAVMAKKPKEGLIGRYLARNVDGKWRVAFGRLDDKKERFLVAFEAIQGASPQKFTVKTFDPPKPEKGDLLAMAVGVETSLEKFQGEQRPYNVVVLPSKEPKGWHVYVVPAPTVQGVWPLGGDTRYTVSPDGRKLLTTRQLHKAIIELQPPPEGQQLVTGTHTHVLSTVPEDTDIFHVLTRKPATPELITTEEFVYMIERDGSIKVLGKTEDVLKGGGAGKGPSGKP